MRPTTSLIVFFSLFLSLYNVGCSSPEEQESNYFDKAKQFIADKDYQEAVLELKNTIQLNPANDEARLLLGETYMEMGEVLLSIQAYDEAVKQNPDNLEAQLKIGQVMLVAQNSLNARKIAKIILEKEPDNVDALLLLAAIQVQENNPTEALKTLKDTVALHPEGIRARLLMAHLYEVEGDPDAAERVYLKAVSVSPATLVPYIKLMRFYAVNGQGKKATDVFELMLGQVNEYDPELMDLAAVLEKQEMPEIAEKVYKYGISTAPGDTTRPLLSMGLYYARIGDSDQALRCMTQALDIDSQDIDVLVNIANLHLSLGDIAHADAEVDKALEIDPDHVGANFIKAVIAYNEKSYMDASDRFDFVIKNSPDNAMAYYFKALCQLGNDSLSGTDNELFRAAAGYSDDVEAWVNKQAEGNLLKAIALKPDLQKAKLVLARIYLQDQKLANVRLQLEDVLDSSPDLEQALLLQGALKLLEKDFAGAEAVCKKALENNPDSSQWLARLGIVYVVLQQRDQAEIVCRKALELNPFQFDALQLIIKLSLAEKRFDEALALCEAHREKIKGNPKAEAIVENMAGNVLLAQGFPELAIRKYEQAVDKVPAYLSPRMTIAQLSVAEGRFEDAVSELEEVLSINKNYLPACMALGDIFYFQNDMKQAEKYYRAALKIEAGYGKAANNLAYILSMYDNKITEALSMAQTAVKKLPNDASARDTLGWIQYRLGNTYQAMTELEKSLSLDPNNALANYHMGLVYYKNNEFDKAREYVARALEIDPDFEEAEDAQAMLDM